MKINKIIISGGTIGVIVLGIIASAIWDLLKPFGGFLFELTLNLSVLGIDRFKDGIYQEIAKGFHEGTSLEIFIFIHSMSLAFVITLSLLMLILQKRTNKNRKIVEDSFLNKIFSLQKAFTKTNAFTWFLFVYIIFAGTFITLDLVKQKYVNNATTHFEQISQIIRPHISIKQDILYKSSFSQIQNKDDYVQLINEVEKIAKEKKLTIPEFSFTF